MGGMQVEDYKQSYFNASRNGMIDYSKPELDMTNGLKNGSDVAPSVNGARNEWAVVGVFGRLAMTTRAVTCLRLTSVLMVLLVSARGINGRLSHHSLWVGILLRRNSWRSRTVGWIC